VHCIELDSPRHLIWLFDKSYMEIGRGCHQRESLDFKIEMAVLHEVVKRWQYNTHDALLPGICLWNTAFPRAAGLRILVQ